MTRKIGLDVVRSVAISLVLISHFAKGLDFLGIYGVELFFALSGFLIGGILYRRLAACSRWSFGEVRLFWLRRWWRTLPNYYLFLLLYLPFHACMGGLPRLAGLLPYLAFSQDLAGVHSGFFAVSWSLCVEEWFYLLFPVCILLFVALRCSKRTAFVCTTLLFLIFPPVFREFLFRANDPATVRMMTLPRLDAIFYGVAMAFILARHRLSSPARLALAGIAGLGLAALFVLEHHCHRTGRFVPFYRLAFVGLPVCFSLLLPYWSTVDRLPARWAFLARPITNLSLWSYSIYLSHIPILFAVYAAFGAARENVLVNTASKVAGLAVCLVFSRFVFTRYESRLTSLRPGENGAAG